MPPQKPQVFKLAKKSDDPVILWQIEVFNNSTTVRAGPADCHLKDFPPISHGSARTASNYALTQVRKKCSQGFERVDLPKKSSQFTDLRQKIKGRTDTQTDDYDEYASRQSHQPHSSRYGEEHDHGKMDSLGRYSSSRGRNRGTPYRHPHSRKQDDWGHMSEQWRDGDGDNHDQQAYSDNGTYDVNDGYVPSDHDTDPMADTDSVNSSVIASDYTGPERRKHVGKGVSPLNRRRSARLAKMNTVQMQSPVNELGFLMNTVGQPGIPSQNTVEMKSPLERMETGTRWLWRRDNTQKVDGNVSQSAFAYQSKVPRRKSVKWRGAKKQDTMVQPVEAGSSAVEDVEDGVDGIDGIHKPSLLKKMTTTTGLRSLFGGFDINQSTVSAATEAESGGMLGTSRSKTALKRKSTVLSPTSPGVAPFRKSLKKSLTKKVTIMVPAENLEVSAAGMKRGASDLDHTDSPSPRGHKKPCVRPSMRRRGTSLFGVQVHVYIPPESSWPVDMKAPVVWAVPLTEAGEKLQGRAVYVSNERCLIAADNGTVIELDSTVTPSQLYHLPAAAHCLLPDGDFMYAGCEDGGVYDITHQVPRLLCSIQGFGQVLCVAVCEGVMAVSDQHGKVALVGHDGSLIWKKKSKGEFGWMVRVDGRAVYHGHSKGVTAYSCDDGSQLWHRDTPGSVLSGNMTPDAVLVSCGTAVVKIDRVTSEVIASYDQVGSQTDTIHSTCHGSGLIFAGGNNIACYDEDSGQLVYRIQHDFKPTAMQYFRGRLFCVGQGALSVIDLTETVFRSVQAGKMLTTTLVHADPSAPSFTPLRRGDTLRVPPDSPQAQGVVVECVKPTARRGKLVARALSVGYNKTWEVQLPSVLWSEGTKYVVEDLRPCPHTNYYRIYGSIHELGD